MKQDFITHGGVFHPLGYTRVNTGGTHEENPYGGVQLGLDPQGIPNMLEEGESVFDDFVYSDNIEAQSDLLKKYNIPRQYAGKKYSEIAEALVDEASERPNDEVSYKGMSVMLDRLAQAQEEQKQIAEMKELQKTLEKMSPEERAEFEEALIAGASEEVQEPVEPVYMEPQPTPESTIMAGGGILHKFEDGGKKQNWFTRATLRAAMADSPAVMAASGFTYDDNGNVVQEPSVGSAQLAGNLGVLSVLPNVVTSSNAVTLPAFLDTPGKRIAIGIGTNIAIPPIAGLVNRVRKNTIKGTHIVKNLPPDTTAVVAPVDTTGVNTFDDGGTLISDAFLKQLGDYTTSRQAGGVGGTYKIDTQFPLSGYKTVGDLEASFPYKFFTDYVLNFSDKESVQNYLKALDAGTADGVPKLFADGKLVDGWQDLYKARRTDGKGGIYHLTPNARVKTVEDIPTVSAATQDAIQSRRKVPTTFPTIPITPVAAVNKTATASNKTPSTGVNNLSVIGRYLAPAIGGAAAVYNAFQEPDRYTAPHYTPILPTGQLHLTDPTYRPLDQNMATNATLAAGAGNTRALMNSGLGPSMGAALLANGYNTLRGVGNSLATVWDANNKHRNEVLGVRNANASAIGQFDYGVNTARANALNEAAYRNLQNDLTVQRLNNAAESEKYAAIQNQLDQLSAALASIGKENYVYNQINNNSALGWGTGPLGSSYWKKN